jgi:Aspartyl protease
MEMEHRIHFTRREQQNTLQSHLLVPVSINGRSPFPFCVEPSRSRTLVSARTIETVGLAVEDSPSTLTISERQAYPLLRLESLAVGSAVLNNFEVVVWGSPVIPPEMLANLDEEKLYHLGKSPATPIEAVIECRGVLGADFLRNFRVSLDFVGETLGLER